MEPTQGGSGVIILGVGIILIGILVAAVMVILRKDRSSPQPTTVKARVGFSGTASTSYNLQAGSNSSKVSCWACSRLIEAENRRACPDCGARYHAVGGCEYADIATCRRCGADSISFMEEGGSDGGHLIDGVARRSGIRSETGSVRSSSHAFSLWLLL